VGDESSVSAVTPDWDRERVRQWWDPSRQLLRSIRGYQKWKARGGLLGRVFSRCHVARHRFWSVVSGADIPLNCRLGGGLLLIHPNGVVIHPDSLVGPNCLILQQVTLGNGGARPGAPTLGGHVDVGAGAKVLGGVVIGDHARIGANAVVLCDVPAHCTAVGIPARIVQPKSSHSDGGGGPYPEGRPE
jgi:serine O-acetyltransferase